MTAILKKDHLPAAQELQDGFLTLINKAPGWTSFDVVNKLRRVMKIKKVGHGGTLDPFAEGLLVLGAGRATKELGQLSGRDKRYRALIHFGRTTDSYDVTGTVLSETDTQGLGLSQIESALHELSGEILQTPPMYSAKKVNGQRLYRLARKNKEVERQAVAVSIYEVRIIDWQPPFLEVDLLVSKGTYIRSYAHDLGQRLQVGAYLKALRRTAVGSFTLEESFTVPEFIDLWNREYSE